MMELRDSVRPDVVVLGIQPTRMHHPARTVPRPKPRRPVSPRTTSRCQPSRLFQATTLPALIKSSGVVKARESLDLLVCPEKERSRGPLVPHASPEITKSQDYPASHAMTKTSGALPEVMTDYLEAVEEEVNTVAENPTADVVDKEGTARVKATAVTVEVNVALTVTKAPTASTNANPDATASEVAKEVALTATMAVLSPKEMLPSSKISPRPRTEQRLLTNFKFVLRIRFNF